MNELVIARINTIMKAIEDYMFSENRIDIVDDFTYLWYSEAYFFLNNHRLQLATGESK